MTNQSRVLLVEDDADWLDIYCEYLRAENYLLDTARSLKQAYEFLKQNAYDAVVTDLKMLGFGDDFGGFSVLKTARELNPDAQVVVITGYGSRDTALRAMQQGAYDYVVKPPDPERFRGTVRGAIQARQDLLSRRATTGTKPLQPPSPGLAQPEIVGSALRPQLGRGAVIGNSEVMHAVFERISKAKQTNLPVIVYGEPGTGKQLIVRAIYQGGNRRSRPFSRIDCANFVKQSSVLRNPEKLRGGTLFLDDLSCLVNDQWSFLGACLVGIVTADIRIVASINTHSKSFEDIISGAPERQQLLTALGQELVFVPTLKNRKEDIPALAGHFVSVITGEIDPPPGINISSEAMNLLLAHDYKVSNVRELSEIITSAIELLGGAGTIQPEHILMQDKVSVLFLAANPSDTPPLSLEKEIGEIVQAIQRTTFGDRFTIWQHWETRVTDLQEYLLKHKPDIIHFSGHGTSSSEILLDDHQGMAHAVSPRSLSGLFAVLGGSVRCVVLSACYSEHQAQAMAQHVDSVIGMSGSVGDKASSSFALAFYQALGYGKNVKEAFELGCVQIDLENLEEQNVPKLIALKKDPSTIAFGKRA